MKRLLILRPEPGASATAARARAVGLEAGVCPLFAVEPVEWATPDPDEFDLLLLTSANALRHGGDAVATLTALPVVAVGEATAAAARDAGFTVALTGTGGVEALLSVIGGCRRLLHLTGAEHVDPVSAHSIEAIIVYRATPIAEPRLPDVKDMVVLVHSARAGARLAELVGDRSATAIAAISEAAAHSCGDGWRQCEWAVTPTDPALLELAARLCQGRPR